MVCNPATEANQIFTDLMVGENIDIPDVDIGTIVFPTFPDVNYDTPNKLTNDDLTVRQVNGSGTFDALMQSFSVHLKVEFEKGRISGDAYAKAYVALTEGAMGNATQYLLGKDAAYWQAIAAQNQAKLAAVQIVTAQVEYETAKVQLALAQFQALTAKSEYALNKMRLASAQMEYCTGKFNLEELLPQQKINLVEQGKLLTAQITKTGIDGDFVNAQKTHLTTYEGPKTAAETAVSVQQKELVKEQTESQRAQTLDVRVDGAIVKGAIGKQKDLHAQQILSYQRDTEIKTGRMYLDSWITQKTMDEGLIAPTQFTNAIVDQVFGKIKLNSGL